MDISEESRRIVRILDGDRNAYAGIVDDYKTPIYNLAYRMTGNPDDAEDLAQETFLRAYEGLKGFDIHKPLFPWLYTIALNLIRNHLRKKRPLQIDQIEQAYAMPNQQTLIDPEKRLDQRQSADRIFQAVQKLPLTLREAIVLRYYQELPFKELADLLNISLSAAKMRVYRALEVLSRTMGHNP